MLHVHIYHSARHLFMAEMRVLFWIQAFFALGSLIVGYIVFGRFRSRQRSVLWAGIHLAWILLFWLFFLFMWYFWNFDRGVWQSVISPWHYIVFRISLGLAIIVTVMGLVLHHGKPKKGFTGRLSWLHLFMAVGMVGLWGISDWIFH